MFFIFFSLAIQGAIFALIPLDVFLTTSTSIAHLDADVAIVYVQKLGDSLRYFLLKYIHFVLAKNFIFNNYLNFFLAVLAYYFDVGGYAVFGQHTLKLNFPVSVGRAFQTLQHIGINGYIPFCQIKFAHGEGSERRHDDEYNDYRHYTFDVFFHLSVRHDDI